MGILSRLVAAGDLVLWHDYRNGTFQDLSGNGNHGVPDSGVILTNSGIRCSGTSKITVTDSSELQLTAVTLVFYFQNGLYNYNSDQDLIAKRDAGGTNYNVYLNTSSQISWWDGDSAPDFDVAYLGSKSLIFSATNGQLGNLYLDGVFGVQSNATIDIATNDANLLIGNVAAGTRPIRGNLLSAVAVINRTVTAAEAAQIHADLIGKPHRTKFVHTKAYGLPIDEGVTSAYSFPGVADLTGNGNDASITGTLNSTDDTLGKNLNFLDNANNYVSLPLAAWPGTTGAIEAIILCRSNLSFVRWVSTSDSSGYEVRAYSTADGSMRFVSDTNLGNRLSANEASSFSYNKPHHIVFEWEYDGSTNTTAKIFIDGVQGATTDTEAGYISAPDTSFLLGLWALSSYDGTISACAIHNEVRTEAEWASRAKAFFEQNVSAIGPGARVTVSNITAGNIPGTPFEINSGTWAVNVETVNGKPTKVVECIAAGDLIGPWSSLQQNLNEAAYGTWDFWVSKAEVSTTRVALFLTEHDTILGSTNDGYCLTLVSTEREQLQEILNGVTTTLFASAESSISVDTWYNYKITRGGAGSFSVYRDGSLITVESGTNPVTDTTHTSGGFLGIEMDAGDKIALTSLDGEPLFKKYLGIV